MKITCYLLLFLTAFLPLNSSAQIIDNIEKSLDSHSSGSKETFNSGGSEYWWLELVLEVGYYGSYGLLFGFEDEPRPNDVMFSGFPYEDGKAGLYQPLDRAGYRVRTEVLAHLQTNEDALFGGYGQIRFFPNRAMTIDVNHLQLFEQLEDGGNNRFSITNFNLQFNRVRNEKFHLWWGGGLMLLNGDLLYGSPSFSSGFDWFFKKPLSLHAETQLAFPNGVFTRQNQARMQVHLGRFMVYAGTMGLRVGEVRVPNWILGTGIYF